MPAEVEVRQYWVRSDEGKVWGPVSFATIDLFVANRIITGRVQVSDDGVQFADPGRFTDIREAFPPEMWGTSTPGTGASRPPSGAIPPVIASRRPPSGPPVLGPPLAGGSTRPMARAVAPPVLEKPLARPITEPAAPPSVSASEQSLFKTYYELAAAGATGKLTAIAGDTTYELFLRKGVPQQLRSSDPGDGVLLFLGEQGLLGAEQAVRAELGAEGFGGDPLAAAFGMGLFSNPGAVASALVIHGQRLLQRLLCLASARTAFDESAPLPGGAMPLGQKWMLLAQAARGLSGDEARLRLGESLDAPVMKSGGRVAMEELGLTAQEARVAAAFEGVRSVAQLAEALGDANLVARVCYVLGEVDLASFAAVRLPRPRTAEAAPAAPATLPDGASAAARPQTVARSPVAPPSGTRPNTIPARPSGPAPVTRAPPVLGGPARAPSVAGKPAPPTSPGPPAATPINDAVALQRVLAAQTKQDHFAVLGLKPSAGVAQVKAAYLYRVRVFHPDSTPPDAPPEIRALKQKIFTRINEANAVVGDETARAAYVRELEAGGGAGEGIDARAIFRAEDLFLKACIVVKARRYADALKLLDEAIQLNAAEGEFYAWRGFATFMLAPNRAAAAPAGLAEMNKALKMSPRCAPAAYFAGQIQKLLGENAPALGWFKKALELDPQHSDAQRELRALNGK